MKSKIKRWGSSAAVRLTSKVLAQAKLDISSPIHIEVEVGKITIKAVDQGPRKCKLPFSEADLLKDLNVHGAHADEIAQFTAGEF